MIVLPGLLLAQPVVGEFGEVGGIDPAAGVEIVSSARIWGGAIGPPVAGEQGEIAGVDPAAEVQVLSTLSVKLVEV